MNTQEALDLHARFLDLKALVEQKVPKKKTFPHPWKDDQTMTYELTHVVLEDLQAHYRVYIGCGDYEYTTDYINIADLLEN